MEQKMVTVNLRHSPTSHQPYRGVRRPWLPYAVIFVLTMALMLSIAQTKSAVDTANKAIQQTKLAVQVSREAQEVATNALAQLKEGESVQPQSAVEPPAVIAEPLIAKAPESTGKTIIVTTTAYCPCVHCCGIWSAQHPSRIGTGYVQKTSSGAIPVAGRTIATDPDVIPYGSRVLINGHEYIAEDTGSGVNGYHIDIYFDSHDEARNWELQTTEVVLLAQ